MRPTILLLALFISVCSCNKNHKDFNEKLDLTLAAKFYGKVTINCATERNMSCEECRLLVKTEKDGNTTTASFSDILVPTTCASAPGPAYGYIDMGSMVNGSYPLIINNGKKQSKGTVVVTDESYSLSFDNLNDISVLLDKILRVPVNTIWGNATYPNSFVAKGNSFTDSLVYFGATAFGGQDGQYTDFEIKNANIVGGNDRFIYKYSGDPVMVDSMVERFRRRMPGSYITITMVTGSGTFHTYPLMDI